MSFENIIDFKIQNTDLAFAMSHPQAVWKMRRVEAKNMQNDPFFTQRLLRVTLIGCLGRADVSCCC